MGDLNLGIDIAKLKKSAGGGGGGGGLTVDELWSGNVTSTATDITSSLAHPFTDYKFLCISQKDGYDETGSDLLYVPNLNATNYFVSRTKTMQLQISNEGATVKVYSNSSMNNVKLLGIK